jgi:hypothetical protein
MDLKKYYYDISKPGALSGQQQFLRSLRAQGVKHDPHNVIEWLKNEESYSLHKPIRKKFTRNKVIVPGIDDTWQIDLVDLKKHAKINKGFHYILTIIDVFSKFAWAIPVKRKNGNYTTLAFKSVLIKSKRCPKKIQLDKGTEFLNSSFKKLLVEYNIKYYHLKSSVKACIIERFNRTLKEKMWRYFTYLGKYKYIDVLAGFLESYNSSFHRTIQCSPNEVNKINEKKIWLKMYCEDKKAEAIKFNFKIGDKVRITKLKNIFAKGYEPNWTQQVFVIREAIPRFPPVYRIKDLLNDSIEGIFYEPQLQKVSKNEIIYKVDSILKRRIKDGRKQVLVSWLGYPDKHNSWVDANQIVKATDI